MVGGWALAQLWLFRVAPVIGGALGGLVYKIFATDVTESEQAPLEKLTQQAEAVAQRADASVPL